MCGEKEVDFAAAFRWLREKWKVKTAALEGGAH